MTTTQRIEAILEHSRQARNSDIELWLIYAQKSGMNLTQHQIEVLRGMPTFETIRRTRQKIQEQGKYPADELVREERYTKFKKMKGTIGIKDADPEKILEAQGYTILPYGM
jgi:hypothetical protein